MEQLSVEQQSVLETLASGDYQAAYFSDASDVKKYAGIRTKHGAWVRSCSRPTIIALWRKGAIKRTNDDPWVYVFGLSGE